MVCANRRPTNNITGWGHLSKHYSDHSYCFPIRDRDNIFFMRVNLVVLSVSYQSSVTLFRELIQLAYEFTVQPRVGKGDYLNSFE